MWISRAHYDDTRLDAEKWRTAARIQADQNIAQRATIEWLCTRLTQVERERALLIQNYMGIAVEVPDIRPAPTVEVPLPATLERFQGAGMFDDVGDKAARELGIDWGPDGRIVAKDEN